MARHNRLWWMIGAAVAVPIVPFLLAGDWIEQTLTTAVGALAGRPLATAAAVVTVLATDLFLPVPATAVATLAGQTLGPALAGFCVWTGMMISSAIGFEASRRFGTPVAERFCRPAELADAAKGFRRWGAAALILTRPMPVLAEACVLLAGVHAFPRGQFYPIVAAATAALAAIFVALGWFSRGGDWTAAVLMTSAVLPLLLAVLLRWRHR